jgi:hypothetical protein
VVVPEPSRSLKAAVLLTVAKLELLGPSPAPPVQLTVILRRSTRGEELRLPQQRLNRLAAR